MTRKEARDVLEEMRPSRPTKTEGRKLQRAIDVAIATMDSYEDLIRAIAKEIH